VSLLGSRGGNQAARGGEMEDRMKKEIDIEQGKRRESIGKTTGRREGTTREEGKGEKSVM